MNPHTPPQHNPTELPNAQALRQLVVDIAAMHMPFGMYGPAKFPPKGCPIMDLPQEYLAWFQLNGFPKGKLGYLLQQCLLLKGAGFDMLFEPFRQANGGRATGRKRTRRYNFGQD